jgi:hypothetical protein
MAFSHHSNPSSHIAYIQAGHSLNYAFQKAVLGAPMPKKKEILQEQSATQKCGKKCESKVPESFLDPQESILLKNKGHLKGYSTKSAFLHESASEKLCFYSCHWNDSQTKCWCPKAEETSLIRLVSCCFSGCWI